MLSIIIVNYNSLSQLECCLSSISDKLGDFECETIVVNNDNESLSPLFTKQPRLKTIEINRNIGFGAACNLGAGSAGGKYLCFLNPDTEIISTDIRGLLKNFETEPNLGIAGPLVLTTEGLPQPWSFGKDITLWSIIKNNLFPSKPLMDKPVFQVDWVSGAALFIRKELFEKLGGFDEDFFMYFEDVDLCKRARAASFDVLLYSDFHVVHFGGKSFEDKKIQEDYYYESQDKYFLKHFGVSSLLLLRFLRLFH